MAVNEKVKELCNDIYATQDDVKRLLKTPLISGLWRQIIDYRNEFKKPLGLKHTNDQTLSVCYTPTIADRINNIERKLNSNNIAFLRLRNALSETYFLRESFHQILGTICRNNNLVDNDFVLDAVIDLREESISSEYKILTNYYKCINYIYESPREDIDENTIGNLFQILQGSEDLTEYYRSKDIRASMDDMASNRPFIGVPVRRIEELVDQLLNFTQYGDCGLFVKAVATFYYFVFIKPFDDHNEEIACLLFKKILAYNDVDSYAACIPVEKIISDPNKLREVFNNVQRDYDLTYLVVYFLDLLEDVLEDSGKLITTSQQVEVKQDLYQADEVENENKSLIEKPHQEDLFNILSEENDKEKEPEPEFNYEEAMKGVEEDIKNAQELKSIDPKELVEHYIEKIDRNKESKKTEEAFEPKKSEVKNNEGLSMNVPTTLTDEEAQNFAERLSEMDPRLSKGQAKFLSKHCSVGFNYTVDQYKKEIGCAYETARTSMNELVELGYYEKKLFRKKFIYTPLNRR